MDQMKTEEKCETLSPKPVSRLDNVSALPRRSQTLPRFSSNLPSALLRQARGPEAGICSQGKGKVSSKWPFAEGTFSYGTAMRQEKVK